MSRLSQFFLRFASSALALTLVLSSSSCPLASATVANSSGGVFTERLLDNENASCVDCKKVLPVIRTVPSDFLLQKFRSSAPSEIDVHQIDESMFTFSKDGFQFVHSDPDIKEVVTRMEEWSQHPRTRQVKTTVAELQYHMERHMRRFLRRVLPASMKAYDVKYRALPNKSGDSPHQNERPQLHQDFNKFPFRVWLPRQRLDGGLIVSPSKEPPFQLFGAPVDVGDAWVFHSDVFHGPVPAREPEGRGYIGTFAFCDRSEGLCFGEEEDKVPHQAQVFLLA